LVKGAAGQAVQNMNLMFGFGRENGIACVGTQSMTNEEFQAAPVKSPITTADLDKIDIRVGTILSVEDVIGSDKLVKLVVDFGDRRRNILAE